VNRAVFQHTRLIATVIGGRRSEQHSFLQVDYVRVAPRSDRNGKECPRRLLLKALVAAATCGLTYYFGTLVNLGVRLALTEQGRAGSRQLKAGREPLGQEWFTRGAFRLREYRK
jgi:hypothetical protein